MARKAVIEKMVEDMKEKQAELRKAGAGMQGLQSQLSENALVREELERLADGAKVYKLVGPVLIGQELDEAKATVSTRIGFIEGEVGKAQARVTALETENQKAQVVVVKAQQEFQAAVQEAAKADPSLLGGQR